MKKRKIILGAMLLGTLTFGTVGLLTSCNDNTVNPGEDLTVTWSGVDTVTLQMNDPQPTDLLEGVKAVASDGTELEVRIDTNSSAQYVDTGYPGTYVVYYYAYLDGEQVDPDDTGYAFKTWVVERGTVLDNSTFDTGVTGWSGNGNAGSVMEYSWDEAENALRVDITNSGGEYWNNQVEYNGLNLDANTTYEISFKAKSTTGRNIGASIEVPAEGYAVVGEYANCLGLTTTDEYQEFKFYYTTTEAKSAIKLGILLGRFTEADDAPSTVWIDDVYVNKLEKTANTSGVVFENAENVEISNLNELETLPEVTAKDANGNEVKLTKRGVVPTSFTSTMTLANWAEEYSYTDSEGNFSYVRRQITWRFSYEPENPYDTYNGDFDLDSMFWNLEENGHITIDFVDGTAVIKSTKDSSTEADWAAQIQQNNVGNTLTAGETYVLQVVAKIDNPNVKTLRGEFCATPNANAKFDLVFDATDTYQTFTSQEFTPVEDVTGGNLRVGLLLAEYSQAYTLTVDSIQIVKVSE